MRKGTVRLFSVLESFNLKPKELKVYQYLLKRSMTLKQLKKLTKISERALRYYISDLLSKGFVKRKIVEAERLHYVYIANPADSVLDSIVKKIKERC